jgi:PEP-CTERM motif
MRAFFLIALLALATASAVADPITLNFDNLKDSIKVTTQFTGLTFTNATTLTSGVTLNELEFPPKSGSNVVFNDGGAMIITFTAPILSFEAYFTYDSRLTLTAFDEKGNQVGSLSSQFLNNLALSGVAGSKPNELLSLASVGITKIVISSTGSFVLDDLKYNGQSAAVPEPATLALMFGGGAVLLGARRKRQKKS